MARSPVALPISSIQVIHKLADRIPFASQMERTPRSAFKALPICAIAQLMRALQHRTWKHRPSPHRIRVDMPNAKSLVVQN